MFENNISDSMITVTAILPESKMSALLVGIVVQDAMGMIFQNICN